MQQIGRATQEITQTTQQINETTRQISQAQRMQQTQQTQETLQLVVFMLVFKLMRSAANQQRQGQNRFLDEVSLSNAEEPSVRSSLPSSPSSILQDSPSASYDNPSSSSNVPKPPVSFPVPPVPSSTSLCWSSADFERTLPEVRRNTSSNEGRAPQDSSSCSNRCSCRCHHLRTVQITPRWLSSLFGQIYLQSPFFSSLFAAATCNDATCRRTRDALFAVKYQLPMWFFAVDAKLRIDAIPIHFCIQTPRAVANLDHFLYKYDAIRVHDIQKMLSLRQITLHDVDSNGWSILHVSLYTNIIDMRVLTVIIKHLFDRVTFGLDESATLDTIQYVLEAGAPKEWTIHSGL